MTIRSDQQGSEPKIRIMLLFARVQIERRKTCRRIAAHKDTVRNTRVLRPGNLASHMRGERTQRNLPFT